MSLNQWMSWLKAKLPSMKQLKNNRYLSIFGGLIHRRYLWHFQRRNVSKAVAIGLFCSALPMPFQMIPATFMALIWRAHLPVSIVGVWVSNPITMPFFMIFQYHLGAFLMGGNGHAANFEMSLTWFSTEFTRIWQPLLLGAIITGLVVSVSGYIVTNYAWRYFLVRKWRKRQEKHVRG